MNLLLLGLHKVKYHSLSQIVATFLSSVMSTTSRRTTRLSAEAVTSSKAQRFWQQSRMRSSFFLSSVRGGAALGVCIHRAEQDTI